MPEDTTNELAPSSPNCEGERLTLPDGAIIADDHPAQYNATIPRRDETLPLCEECLRVAIATQGVVCVSPLDSAADAEGSIKDRILHLYTTGTTDIAEIVRRVRARPSYVAQVLQSAGFLQDYFDLYTTTGTDRNVYSRFFRNVLSFRSVEDARESVLKLSRLYDYFERLGDRAGQHEATLIALLGKNRARWSGKMEESEIFSEWLKTH